MTGNRLRVAGALVALIAAAEGGYLLGRNQPTGDQVTAATLVRESRAPKPLYYQDPDGKPIYSPTPRKTADGRDFKPVYAERSAPPGKQTASANSQAAKPGRILYYRNPMGLPDISPVPKKDPMGMDYIPVYAGENEAGVVTVSPARLQMLGVKTAPVQVRSSLTRNVRATGTIQADESGLADVTTKFDCVVEKLFVSTTGAKVHAGEPLARVWIQTPETMMQIGPDVVTREIDYVVALQDENPAEIAAAEHVLREYGLPDSSIAEIRRTGRATRSVTITAPRDGVVLDKPAIEGKHFNTGDPLFRIADLSTVWLMADVEEQDLGAIRVGETARAALVAYPGRTFTGKVDFIYPTLMAGTRTGRVRIVLPNPDGSLRESMYANVAIETPVTSGARVVVVPDSSVIDSGTRQVVLVVRGEGRFEPRTVHIGAEGGGYTQILDGVKSGEQVVVSANFLIDAESNLRAALSSFGSGGP
ncbi:MAG TPA: efflux RND transporter periplasmic adaptor subunit [Rhizomicrobium sp.]|jgi:Cu(I)/Ag(I) efflux system membrane fusion protein|nr:efflux RND transporter periplasmic adaptor subunit [Rhizomicrobium sp.]